MFVFPHCSKQVPHNLKQEGLFSFTIFCKGIVHHSIEGMLELKAVAVYDLGCMSWPDQEVEKENAGISSFSFSPFSSQGEPSSLIFSGLIAIIKLLIDTPKHDFSVIMIQSS